jgi:diguanylate cyclase (GGDEF)-like protein
MASRLDLFTIVVLTAISAFLMGVGMIVASATHASQERPLRHWGYSCLLQGMGWILVGMRDDVPLWLSVVGGNTAIFLSSLCYLRSIETFMQGKRRGAKPERPVWTQRAVWVLSLIFAPALLVLTITYDSLPVRIVIISAALAYTTSLCARRLLSVSPIPPSRLSMAVGFCLVSVSQVGRIVATVFAPPQMPELHNARPMDSLTFLVGFIAVVMLTFLFALMVNDHTADELRRLATHDSLTRTFNRSAFEGYARQAIEQALRKDDDLSLLLFDIDHFKSINDTLGHQAGDVALRQMAKLANQCLRSQDIFGRYGGEEFAVLLPGTDAAGAYLVAERIRRNIEAGLFHDEGTEFRLTISGGITQLIHGGRDSTERRLSTLFRNADEALYDAKDKGRNRNILAGAVTAPPPIDAPMPSLPRTKPRSRPER